MNIGTKKALGIVTHKQPARYQEIIDNLPFSDIDQVYVIDTSPEGYKYAIKTDNITVIEYGGMESISIAKNLLMKYMVVDGFEHIFLMEDSVRIDDGSVFEAYIETARQFGLWGSLNYAWGGRSNITNSGMLKVKNAIQGDGLDLIFTQNQTATFSYIHKSIIEDRIAGYFDEFYLFGCEHLDYYLNQTNEKLASYFWWFTDIEMSGRMLSDINDHSGYVPPTNEIEVNSVEANNTHFKEKFGFKPTQTPEATPKQVLNRIDYLVEKYSC